MEPEASSTPLHTRSYRSPFTSPGLFSKSARNLSCGMVNMWCAGSHFFSSAFHSKRGKSMIQQNLNDCRVGELQLAPQLRPHGAEGDAGGAELRSHQQDQVTRFRTE